MSDPWFNGALYGWIPGTVFGVLAGVFGSCVGMFASQGIGKRFILAGFWLMLIVSVTFLGLGIFALVTGQPYGVWYALLLPGVIGFLIFGCNLLTMRTILKRFQEVEERKMAARDL